MLVSQILISAVLHMIYAFVIVCLVNQNGGVFHLMTVEKVSSYKSHEGKMISTLTYYTVL